MNKRPPPSGSSARERSGKLPRSVRRVLDMDLKLSSLSGTSMLEQRVTELEQEVFRLRQLVHRLEPHLCLVCQESLGDSSYDSH